MIKWHHKIDDKTFEHLICDLFNANENTNTFQIYGRGGQKQYGVDVFSKQKKTLIQCKFKDNIDDKKNKSKLKKEIRDEVKKTFDKNAIWYNDLDKFKHFILISTYYNDTELQNEAVNLKDENQNDYPITISYFGRETIIEWIRKNPKIMIKYFKNEFEQLLPKSKFANLIPKLDLSSIVGRVNNLHEIHNTLQQKSIILLSGIGGIGKTSIVLAYINNPFYANNFEKLAWVSVKNDFLKDFIFQLSNIDGFSYDDNQSDTINFINLQQALSKFGTKQKNLLVIDNWNSPNEISEYKQKLLDTYWQIIITTRSNIDYQNNIEIKQFELKDAIELFGKYYKLEINTEILTKLIISLEFHPLLIELIAKVGNKRNQTIKKLYSLIEKSSFVAKELQRKIPIGLHAELSNNEKEDRIKDYVLSIFEIDNLSDIDIHLLQNLSILPHENEINILKEIFAIEHENEIGFEESFDGLHKNGWIKQSGKFIHIHPIVQTVLLEKLKPTTDNCISLVVNLWKILQWSELENTYIKQKYLPYAESILDKLRDNHVDLGQLANYCSIIYHDLRKNDIAIKYAERYVQIHEVEIQDNEDDDFMLGSIMNAYRNLAILYSNMNIPIKSKEYRQKFIEVSKKYISAQKDLGKGTDIDFYDELDLANQLEGIADFYDNTDENRLLYQLQALKIRERKQENKTNDLILSYDNISKTYQNIEDYQKAFEFSKKALNLSEKYLPENHKYNITVENNHSIILAELDKWEASLEMAELAYKHNKINFEDETHPTFAEILNNIAIAHLGLNNKMKATEYIKKAIVCWEKLPYQHEALVEAKKFYNDMVKIMPIKIKQKIGRNELCPCGSGMKYKKCCGKNK